MAHRLYPDTETPLWGYARQVQLPDGRSIFLLRKMYTWSICLGDDQFIEEHWCYPTRNQAEAQFDDWNPLRKREPSGWIRHPASGRRRPDGDKTREYVAP